jgi:hypothetical protein
MAKAAGNSRLLAPAPQLRPPRHGKGVGKFYTRRRTAEFARREAHEYDNTLFLKLTLKFLESLAPARDVAVIEIPSENFTLRFGGATGSLAIRLGILERPAAARILH